MKGKLAGKVAVALYHRLQMRYGLGVFRGANALQRVANALQPRRFGFRGQPELAGGLKHTGSGFAGNLNSRAGLNTPFDRKMPPSGMPPSSTRCPGPPVHSAAQRAAECYRRLCSRSAPPKYTKKDHHGTPAAGAAAAENETPE
jgi:hypothetical protein